MTKKKRTRRELLTAGLASITILFSGGKLAAKAGPEQNIKVLTKSGELIEIPKSRVRVRRKAGKSEIENWTGNKTLLK